MALIRKNILLLLLSSFCCLFFWGVVLEQILVNKESFLRAFRFVFWYLGCFSTLECLGFFGFLGFLGGLGLVSVGLRANRVKAQGYQTSRSAHFPALFEWATL